MICPWTAFLRRSFLQKERIKHVLDYIEIGTVISTHGLKGEVKVFPTTEDIHRFDRLRDVYVVGGDCREKLEAEGARYFKDLVILKFKGVDRIEEAERYLKKDLYVERKDALPLGEDEFFVGDLFGLKVVDEDGRLIGEIVDVLGTGANDVYVVQRESDPKKELLLPAIRDCIKKISPEEGTVTVHLLPGLE